MINVYTNLSVDEYLAKINNALSRGELLIIIGNCTVDYTGRGESKLTDGDRVVIVKNDGAVIIHRPFGYKPVNWQPGSSLIEARRHGDYVVLTAIRDKPREILNVSFRMIYLLIVSKLVDQGEFVMYMSESEIRDILYKNPDLIERGLRVVSKEKDLGMGVVDLIAIDSHENPVLIEIKRTTATKDAVLQLYSYVKRYEELTGRVPRGILVAPSVSAQALDSLSRLKLEFREIDLKKLWKLRKTNDRGRDVTLNSFIKEERGAGNGV